MNYVRKLGFEETPNYDFIRDLFTKVLDTLGEPEDGIFDWMLLNGGKGWEASNVRVPLVVHCNPHFSTGVVVQGSNLLAQVHASTPHTPHRDRDREHRRDREHGGHRRGSRQLHDNNTPSTPLVLSPAPAHVKVSSRRQERERGTTSKDASVQPLAPTPRRASQQQQSATPGGLTAPHPYAAAPSSSPYRTNAGGYERQSPAQHVHAAPNGSATHLGQHSNTNRSESFLYGGHVPPGKNGTASRDGTATGGTTNKQYPGGATGMMIYDSNRRRGVGGYEDGGRRKESVGLFCCRG